MTCIDMYFRFTKLLTGSVKLLSPKYSFFIQGLRLMNDTGGYINPNPAFGFLMLLGAPIQEPCRIVGGVVGASAGLLSTAVTGVAYAGQKVGQSLGHLRDPTPSELERQRMTDAFVERLNQLLINHKLSAEDKANFVADPLPLVGFGAFWIGFNSRHLEGRQLNTAFGIINEARLENQPDICKRYFDYVCQIKDELRDLKLSKDDHEAWMWLSGAYSTMCESDTYYREYDHLTRVIDVAKAVGELITTDEYFVEAWRQANN